jgi:hypothetical protein
MSICNLEYKAKERRFKLRYCDVDNRHSASLRSRARVVVISTTSLRSHT